MCLFTASSVVDFESDDADGVGENKLQEEREIDVIIKRKAIHMRKTACLLLKAGVFKKSSPITKRSAITDLFSFYMPINISIVLVCKLTTSGERYFCTHSVQTVCNSYGRANTVRPYEFDSFKWYYLNTKFVLLPACEHGIPV